MYLSAGKGCKKIKSIRKGVKKTMMYLQTGITIFIQGLAFLYLKMSERNEKTQTGYKRVAGFFFSVLLTFLVAVLSKIYSENIVEFSKIMVIFQVLFCASVIDYRKKIIPNALLGIGALLRLLCYVAECLYLKVECRSLMLHDLFGLVMGAGTLFLIYFFSKGSVGLGDVKLFGILGMYLGFSFTFRILFLAVMFSALCAMYLLFIKHKSRKYSLAFAPFVFAGFLVSLLVELI